MKLLLASVATIGLLLAGPQKASAQVLNACVTSIGNISILAGPNSPCPGGTKTTLSTTPGAVAAREYDCGTQSVAVNGNVSFTDSGIGFGTTLPTGTTSFTSFLLQPGFYQAHLNMSFVQSTDSSPQVFKLNGIAETVWLIPSAGSLSGDRLFSVTTANTSATLELFGGSNAVSIVGEITIPCLLNLTQLH